MVQSVDRALVILEMLADGPAELGVTELGSRLEVHKSTASRLLSTLTDHQLVELNPHTGKYRLAFGVVRLAGAVAATQDLVQTARPVLQDLAERSSEAVNLSVLEADQVVSLHQIAAPHVVTTIDWVGRRTPVHCSSSGKAILANLPTRDRDRLLTRPLERRTPRTITDRARLRRQLDETLRTGFAFTTEELELGLNGVAAPVRNASGQTVAAISVSGPSFRVTLRGMPALSLLVKEAAGRLSRRLGYRGGSES